MQTIATPHGKRVFEHLFLQHMCNINFLIIATFLSYTYQQHLLGVCVLLQSHGSLLLQYSTSCTIITFTYLN